MNLSNSSKLIMALDSDCRAKAVLNKLGGEDGLDSGWSKSINKDCVEKSCSGKLNGKTVSLVATEQPLEVLSQLGFDREQVILIVGNKTRGPGEISLNPNDVYIQSNHPKLKTLTKFPQLVGVYKESKSTEKQAASLIEQILLDQE